MELPLLRPSLQLFHALLLPFSSRLHFSSHPSSSSSTRSPAFCCTEPWTAVPPPPSRLLSRRSSHWYEAISISSAFLPSPNNRWARNAAGKEEKSIWAASQGEPETLASALIKISCEMKCAEGGGRGCGGGTTSTTTIHLHHIHSRGHSCAIYCLVRIDK